MTRVILASGSVIRRAMFEKAGLDFDVIPAAIDEDAITASLEREGATPVHIALTLAELKAARVSGQHPEDCVIAADSVITCEGRSFTKPEDAGTAKEHLRYLRGRTHENICGVCLAKGGVTIWRHTDIAKLTMRDFSDTFLDAFVEKNVPGILSSAGAYRFEDTGVQLFSKIEGDYFTILGLPLLPVLNILREHRVIAA